MSIRVAVVDDHPLYRDGVVFTLSCQPDIEIVGIGATAADAFSIASDHHPDVLILDMNLPGGGLTALEAIRQHQMCTRVLILSVGEHEDQVRPAMKAGASGYMLKGGSGAELAVAIKIIHSGGRYITPSLAVRLLSAKDRPSSAAATAPDKFASLTPRESEILEILIEGRSNKEIGNRLAVTEKTIKHHLTSILQKLSVRNRVEAALLASHRRPAKVRLQPSGAPLN